MSTLYDYRNALRRALRQYTNAPTQYDLPSTVVRTHIEPIAPWWAAQPYGYLLVAERRNGATYVVLDPELARRLLDLKGPSL